MTWQRLARATVLVALLFDLPSVAVGSDNSSCECPKLECGPCTEERGLTFYSEKCGVDQSQVKSCARPTCVPLENPPANCKSSAKVEPPSSRRRDPASSEVEEVGPEIGRAKAVSGVVWIKSPRSEPSKIGVGTMVHEKDRMWADPQGRAQIEFTDGNVIHVLNAAELKIEKYEPGVEGSRSKRALIELIRGRVRSQVNQKYEDNETSSFKVRTKTAVAGVRGTDFLVSYKEGDRSETRIDTLEGKVILGGAESSDTVEIAAGERASFVSKGEGVFSDVDVSEFVASGYLTPVFKLSADELKQLDRTTWVGSPSRGVASSRGSMGDGTSGSIVCHSPKADLNQCLWTCERNPRGEAKCRVDLPDVACVRRRCNANGDWAEETQLPSTFSGACSVKPVLAPCDY